MPFPLALGGSQAAIQTAQAANSALVKPAVGSATQSAGSFAGAMQAAAAKSAASASQANAQKAQTALTAFRQTLMQLMAANQVNTSQPIQLESDGQGGVQVAGDSPDSDKIMSIFHDHPELVAQFQSLAQSFAKLRAADPTQAAADAQQPPVFGITINGQQAQATFQ
jgi:hypothetical protein